MVTVAVLRSWSELLGRMRLSRGSERASLVISSLLSADAFIRHDGDGETDRLRRQTILSPIIMQ